MTWSGRTRCSGRTGTARSSAVNGSRSNSMRRAARVAGKRPPSPRAGAGTRRTAWTQGRCGLRSAGMPAVPGAGRRSPSGADGRHVPGLRRRSHRKPRGVAVSGRTANGAPDRTPLRHRGRPTARNAGGACRAGTGCRPPTRSVQRASSAAAGGHVLPDKQEHCALLVRVDTRGAIRCRSMA